MTCYLKARQVWHVVSGDLQRPDCQFKYAKPITADTTPLVEPHLNGAVRQRAIEARLEVEVQAFERHKKWSRREAEAYHIIFCVHVAGLETTRELWNELEENYRRMELNIFCELFAQVRETTTDRCASTREFVDRVRLLVHRLNAIAPGSIGDRAHIAILLTQIGPEYVLVVDAIQNDKDQSIRRRLETVSLMPSRRCSERKLLRSRTEAPGSSSNTSINTVQKTARKCAYSTATSHVCWDRSCFVSLRAHCEMLDTAANPMAAEGIATVKLTLRGKYNRPLVLKNVYFAPQVGMNLISVPKLLRDRYSVVAHPQNAFVQRRGRTVGTAYHAEEDLRDIMNL
ncbi:hypothetical protein AnigIFM59636_002461 [Aspergillus niger]|nr:hypothetical protein AnigIFM59636_002461 [Aspergillus niger]